MLLEAMLATAIGGIIGAGTAHIAARIAVGQHELRAESVSVAQMRALLSNRGEDLCGSSGNSVTLPGGRQANLTIDTCGAAPSITVLPGIVAGGSIPNTVTITGVRPVSARMPLSNLGVQAGSGAAEMVVGTVQ